MSGAGLGRGLTEAVRALAVAEARIAVLRLRARDWSGAYLAAARAEGEAVTAGWSAMAGCAQRLQGRAVSGEQAEASTEAEQRAAYNAWTRSGACWGLW